jgi:hypothetical protein
MNNKKTTVLQRALAAERGLERAAKSHAQLMAVHNTLCNEFVRVSECLATLVYHFNDIEGVALDAELIITDQMRRKAWEFSRLRVTTEVVESESDGNKLRVQLIEWNDQEQADIDEVRNEAKKPKLLGPDGNPV